MERTCVRLGDVKFAEDGAMTVSGYGAVFGNVDSYGDVILPGAFGKTLADARTSGTWPSMLLQHGGFFGSAEDMTPIGIWTDLAEDGHGLKVTGKLADTPRGREVYSLLKMDPRPAIDGLSIGYQAIEWQSRAKPEEPRRTLKAVKLYEVSFVTFPANNKARVTDVKSGDWNIREMERAMASGTLPPLSARDAKALLSGGFKALTAARDAGATDIAAALRRNIGILS